MPAPILATKRYIPPPRLRQVERPRLIARLNAGLAPGCKLTLISTPAGFGKTTLLSSWVYSLQKNPPSAPRVAWLSLDSGDSDPARFLAYLIAALQSVQPDLGAGLLEMVHASQGQPSLIEALLTGLLNEIAALPHELILVLDDYHTLDSQPVDAALAFLVERLPPQMRVVIASREDPPLPLARLRARGQLVELRLADLRFTPAEAAEFLNRVMGLNLAAEHIAALEARTEGWIAGLQLAALALQGIAAQPDMAQTDMAQPDMAAFLQSFTGSHHFVLDYLLEEVLHRQPAALQAFLLRTALLDRLCGPLCEAVLGAAPGQLPASGQATLEYLERANLFIVPLDNERRWYRYHHLFGDLLRQRLGQSLAPAEIAAGHRRASAWYEANGYPAEAFHHALAAQDFARAAHLAETAWPAMDGAFQAAAWLAWFKKLPAEVVRPRPLLNAQAAFALMDTGQVEASEARLRAAAEGLEGLPTGIVISDPTQLPGLPAMIAQAHAYNAQLLGDYAATVKYAEAALRLTPPEDHFRRAQATVILEFSHWANGELEAAYRSMQDWIDAMQQAGNSIFVVATAFAQADILIAQGRLQAAIAAYQQAIQLAAAHGREAQRITAHHHLGLALLYHEMGETGLATHHLQQARELDGQTTLVDWPYRWRIGQARLKESAGDLDAALHLLDEAKRVYVRNPVPDLRPVAALQARIYLRQGRLEGAQAWARQRGLSPNDELSYLHEFEHLTLARVLVAGRSLPDALGLLERLLQAAEAGQRLASVLEILVVQALAYQAQGSTSHALASLARALTLAEPQGYFRLFIDEGPPLAGLLANLSLPPAGEKLKAYLHRLLAAAHPPQAVPPPAAGSPPATPPLIEPLSPRELEVLRLIAQGLSNNAISQQLFLALSTVKGHNLKIFTKLQAQSRTEAVAKARELGLL